MTKAGDKLLEGLREAITMTKLMKENEGLRAENEKLRAALKPFADRSRNYLEGTEWWEVVFTVEECRAAAEALKGNNES